jgi:hypothetical protein
MQVNSEGRTAKARAPPGLTTEGSKCDSKGVNLNKNIKVEIFSLKTNIRKP